MIFSRRAKNMIKEENIFSFRSVVPLLDAHIITPYFSFLLLPFLESSFFALRPFFI